MAIFALAALLFIVAVALAYNRLVREWNRVDSAWSDIDIQLQRRYDLIPQLVSAVKHYADYERATREAVVSLRTAAADLNNVAERGQAEEQLSGDVTRLIALAEQYPDLKADENFLKLQADLIEAENYLQFARRFYNCSVRQYNTRVETVPNNLVAGWFGFDARILSKSVGRCCGGASGQSWHGRMNRVLAVIFAVLPVAALADERILDYHSDIVIQQDGWLEVTETIQVRAESKQIIRGIYRDYPTRYKGNFDNTVKVDYEPLAVFRNGMPEDYHGEHLSNGVRTYFGDANRIVGYGESTYIFRYRAGRMLGFFENHDEPFWNVTGNSWTFPIDRASATVRFGFDVAAGDIEVKAYTGPQGHVGTDYKARTGVDGSRELRDNGRVARIVRSYHRCSVAQGFY